MASILRARTERRDWRPNRPIFSETRLVQLYGPARTTARPAVAVPVEQGLVFTVPQRGTYAASLLAASDSETAASQTG
ncbi:GntR family transcriptional regulator [Streptomyces phaeochromogenes]